MAISFEEVEQASLEASTFERYLNARGWLFDAETRAGGRQWRRGSDLLLLPAPESPDSSLRFYDAVVLLARAESRDPRIVLVAVANAAERTLAVRVVSGSTQGGAIALNEAVELIGATSALVRIAVQRAFAASDVALDPAAYLSDVRFGQTTLGSFGLTVVLPQSDQIDANVSDAIERELVETVLIAESFVEEDPSLVRRERDLTEEQFAELTTSFVDLLADDESRVVEVETLDKQLTGPRRSAALRGIWLPRIRLARDEALRDLRSQQAAGATPEARIAFFEDVLLRGPVVALKRPWVTIEADTPVGARQVRFRLGEAAYRDAVTAHREEQSIMVRGSLRVRPRSAEIRVSEFRARESET